MPNRKEKKARHIFTEKTGLEQEITALKQNLDEQAAKLKECRKEIEDAIVARIQYQEELKNLREENRSLKRRLAVYEPEILADEQENIPVPHHQIERTTVGEIGEILHIPFESQAFSGIGLSGFGEAFLASGS